MAKVRAAVEAQLSDENFSVDIRSGEKIGLVGHSGSGKTTFVKLIQRLYDVNGGAVRIDGQNIADVKQASLRGQIAIDGLRKDLFGSAKPEAGTVLYQQKELFTALAVTAQGARRQAPAKRYIACPMR